METNPNKYWLLGLAISVIFHLAIITLVATGYFAAKPAEGMPPVFALQIGPYQSPVDRFAAKPVTKPKIIEKKPLPKTAIVTKVKPKIVVPIKKEKKPEPKPEEPKPEEPSDNPNEHPDSKKDDGGDAASTFIGHGGPEGNTSSAPVIGTSASIGPTAQQTWSSTLHAHLTRYKRYPPEARRLSRSFGVVTLKAVIDAKGNVKAVDLVKGSGNVYLDRAAQNLVRRASPVPAPPAELLKGKTEITVNPLPINYTRPK